MKAHMMGICFNLIPPMLNDTLYGFSQVKSRQSWAMRQSLSKTSPSSRIMHKIDLLINNTRKSMTGKPNDTEERPWIFKSMGTGLNHDCPYNLVAM